MVQRLRDVFKETIRECERKYGPPSISITPEESDRICNEINVEMREYCRELRRKWTPPTNLLILNPCYV